MFKQRIFLISLIVLVILAIMHFFGLKYEIYFSFEKYDIPMHILGGLWISLTVFWLFPFVSSKCSIKNYKVRSFLTGLLIVIVVALAWDAFELISGLTHTSDSVFLKDTVGDLVCAIIGLIIGFIYFLNQKICADGVCELVRPTSLNNLR